ncbi:hypothetical protein L1987_58779 [Smallanthus sonchifolius]|uniref:Uncharacterized protein n=1 Tax=Smallanthus sonchifolius TaxID=185202 RepID=A0ACB9D3E2_9ASTR|nr:hypothetical protein L1987_58779 [Smallanthus sonchifolius]
MHLVKKWIWIGKDIALSIKALHTLIKLLSRKDNEEEDEEKPTMTSWEYLRNMVIIEWSDGLSKIYLLVEIVGSDELEWLEELNNLDLQNELNITEGVELEQLVKYMVLH